METETPKINLFAIQKGEIRRFVNSGGRHRGGKNKIEVKRNVKFSKGTGMTRKGS